MSKQSGVRRHFIDAVRKAFQAFGIDVHRYQPQSTAETDLQNIFRSCILLRDYQLYGTQDRDAISFLEFCSRNLTQSHSQLLQDLFVLYALRGKRDGYFVEFGATDGVQINNTVMLERAYGWRGVLAEPARAWHDALRQNRTCFISTDCVWSVSGETIEFNQTDDRELSTAHLFSASDSHSSKRLNGERYPVKTISLADLLQQAGAPSVIDYLSIDTEGSEYQILSAFDFGSRDIRIVTVEHNYMPNRELLYQLLTAHGYVRKFEAFRGGTIGMCANRFVWWGSTYPFCSSVIVNTGLTQ